MDINLLNAQFMSQGHIPFGASLSSSQLPSHPESPFVDILRRAQGETARAASDIEAPQLSRTPRLPAIVRDEKLYELCMELETIMVKNLIKSMRSTIQKSNLIDTGFAGEVYEDMLYDEYAKTFAQNANFGFAEMAYRELSGLR